MTSMWDTSRIQIRSYPEQNEDLYPASNKSKKYEIIILGLFVHVLLMFAVFEVYFSSPLDQGMTPIKSTDSPPAKRVVLIVTDGLRAASIFGDQMAERAPYLHSIIKNKGSWGVSHTRVPTESRPGHIAMLAGIYEDPSAILKGWKSNPVYFDSVINQSTNAWAWGSPDIISIFNRDNSPRIYLGSYGSEREDFANRDTSLLDTWVFESMWEFMRGRVATCEKNCTRFFSQGNVFFLHLLGIDTAGHGFKPHSEEYRRNIKIVDENILDMVDLVESVYKDSATAYVFTSDHGMTDWGSHGAGSTHETEAPIIAWGAGIRRYQERQDIQQIDIAPLLASLVGINIPINSLGLLPTEYLDVDDRVLSEIVLSNTLQLYEIFSVKFKRITKTAIVFLPFGSITEETLVKKIAHLKELFANEKYSRLVDECKVFQKFLIQGVNYYHNYYQYPILISVSAGFLIWIAFLSETVLNFDKQSPLAEGKNPVLALLTAIVIILCYKSNFSITYYLYFTFPFVMYLLAFNNFKALGNFLKLRKSIPVQSIFYVAGIELLVYGFYNRIAFTVIMVLLGLWIMIPTSSRVNPTGPQKCIWLTCCFALAIFPALPVMNTVFNVQMIILGYLGWILIFTTMYLIDMKIYKQMENVALNHKAMSVQFVSLHVAAIYIMLLEYGFIPSDSPIKYISWIILALPILMIPLASKVVIPRLLCIFFGFAPFYLLVSPNYEVIFSVVYVASLIIWLIIETKTVLAGNSHDLIYYSKFEPYKDKNIITSEMFRRAFLFMVFIFLGFFGTGNVASLNSFDPMWVRAFLTVFSPFKMLGLILLKFMVPFIFTCSVFRAINSFGKENVLNMFCIILIFSDLMVLQFLYLITNVGSWLDIGSSLSHFIIMEGFVTILLLLYGVAHWLTSVSSQFPTMRILKFRLL